MLWLSSLRYWVVFLNVNNLIRKVSVIVEITVNKKMIAVVIAPFFVLLEIEMIVLMIIVTLKQVNLMVLDMMNSNHGNIINMGMMYVK